MLKNNDYNNLMALLPTVEIRHAVNQTLDQPLQQALVIVLDQNNKNPPVLLRGSTKVEHKLRKRTAQHAVYTSWWALWDEYKTDVSVIMFPVMLHESRDVIGSALTEPFSVDYMNHQLSKKNPEHQLGITVILFNNYENIQFKHFNYQKGMWYHIKRRFGYHH